MHRLTPILVLLLALPAHAQDSRTTPDVVVTLGDAILQRTPDRAFISAGVETRGPNPKEAQRQNSEAMAAVLARLLASKIPKESIRTLGYDIQQEFDYVQGKQVPRDFLARNSVEVRIDDIARVGEILDAVVQAGANSVSGVRFDLADRSAVEREALRLAVADARARADAAAAGAGRAIDRIVRIEESRGEPILARPFLRTMAEQVSVPAIEPGLIEVHARVALTVALK